VREEVEVVVGQPEKLRAILEALGLKPAFRYEKIRATYALREVPGVKLELDVTPIGIFIELEGSPRQIDRAARLLGYRVRDYITRSYLALYFEACGRRGVKPKDMVFPRRNRGKEVRK
jgi:adenylate cyclase class 2